ncbi:MAG: hypothetical protein GY739_04415 [Mesoflavibacter sp.]|nr:hypothetical protein [Mesoflavibacter sp.]
MIKITRDKYPKPHPYRQGVNKGCERWRKVENDTLIAYNNNSIPFEDGTYTFPIHPSYNEWKKELIENQGRKCCYCEKVIDPGELEHYRPKKAWSQAKGSSLTRPGYYWLAYRWNNLLLSCGECNDSSRKGNVFPINGIRAVNQQSDLSLEDEQLINPYEEDPSIFLDFIEDIPVSIHPKGNTTINLLDLQNRADLKTVRRDRWELYEIQNEISKLPSAMGPFTNDKIKKAKSFVLTASKQKHQFSGMIRANISNRTFL